MCRPGESPRLAPQSRFNGDGLDQVPDRVNNQQVSVGSGGGNARASHHVKKMVSIALRDQLINSMSFSLESSAESLLSIK